MISPAVQRTWRAGQLFRQINQALSSNPNLDSKELYELRNRLHQGVTGGSRF